jgi:hypothetical protein
MCDVTPLGRDHSAQTYNWVATCHLGAYANIAVIYTIAEED